MENVRRYGKPSYKIALLHGGPGAPGSMAPIAYGLEKEFGVIEPLQSEDSVQGQVEELNEQLAAFGSPKILIGHSWGAWLAWIYAAKYPDWVSHIILIGSGPFREEYTKAMMENRLNNLDDAQRARAKELLNIMGSCEISQEEFAQLGMLMEKSDTYCEAEPQYGEAPLPLQPEIYENVWPQAAELRRSGELLAMADKIKSKITFIHGKYDPHPYQGIQNVLNDEGVDFEFILFDKCGHSPWKEKYCAERFYKLLNALIKENI